jgi:Xaa-Pro dipeptidase
MPELISRRSVLSAAAATAALPASAVGAAASGLVSLAANAKPISDTELHARLMKLQGLMQEQRVGSLLIEPGSSLEYFTGVRWHRSERITAAIISALGKITVVTPAFEEPSVRETLRAKADVRTWSEDESPFPLLADAARPSGGLALAFEGSTRFFVVEGVRKMIGTAAVVSGDSLVRPCRLIKSAAELALMQVANDITLAAIRHVHANVQAGMRAEDLSTLVDAATQTLGGEPEFSLVLLNEASAYPHGSTQAQRVHEGSVILMDCGCNVHGYQSDISRTWIFGAATAHQRQVWSTVKEGQQIALSTAKLGVLAGALDDAVRDFYVRRGYGPGYRLPGLSHRTGHGIGLDGHEAAYLVHGDATPLQPGMCFSDEPGLYIPGEFGVRLEDCWHMTEAGPRLFTGLADSIDQPI